MLLKGFAGNAEGQPGARNSYPRAADALAKEQLV